MYRLLVDLRLASDKRMAVGFMSTNWLSMRILAVFYVFRIQSGYEIHVLYKSSNRFSEVKPVFLYCWSQVSGCLFLPHT